MAALPAASPSTKQLPQLDGFRRYLRDDTHRLGRVEAINEDSNAFVSIEHAWDAQAMHR